MKKQIISLFLLISLSFQMTYTQEAPATPEVQKGKLQALYKRFGKAKVDGAVATIKRYGPWAIITNYKKANAAYKQAVKENKAAEQLLNSCKAGLCLEQKAKLDTAREEQSRLLTLARQGIAPWNEYNAARTVSDYQVTKYDSCWLPHCKQEEEKRKVAEQNRDKAWVRQFNSEILFIVGGVLGAFAAIFGTIGTAIYFVDKAEQRERAEEKQQRQRAAEETRLGKETEALQKESARLMPELELETQKSIQELEQLERELGAAGG